MQQHIAGLRIELIAGARLGALFGEIVDIVLADIGKGEIADRDDGSHEPTSSVGVGLTWGWLLG